MTKQKTVIDELVSLLDFKADPEALSRADEKLKEFNRRLQAVRPGRNA